MADNWDDSDDEWDVADDEVLDARLGLNKLSTESAPVFDDEEDLAIKDKEMSEHEQHAELKKKGNALLAKKKAEQDRLEEEELARKAMEMEADLEANLSSEELRALKQKQVEDADHALTNDLFGGGGEAVAVAPKAETAGSAIGAGDTVVLRDLKDHLKHARKVAQSIKAHGKIHLAAAFLKEVIQECKDVLDEDAITDVIKTCNVIKNEKVAATKRKVKGQAQKSQKRDKTAEAKAKQLADELYGDSNKYDKYDTYGEDYEDSFF